MAESNQEPKKRASLMVFNKFDFAKLIVNDLSQTSSGYQFLTSYKQSEVREIVENYQDEQNQAKLREISQILYAKSGHYQRLLKYFAGMPLFAHVIKPVGDIRKANTKKVLKQYTEIGELLKLMNLRHEMMKVLLVAFREDVFYGYVYRDKKTFYIQQMPPEWCRITSVEDGIYNYSINMREFEKDESRLQYYSKEIQQKYKAWKSMKAKNSKIDGEWVELDPQNTICIKVNEDMIEIFPPFASIFDAIFDIDAFKQLRKDKEELGNYMVITQELPMRKDSENNNDFLIDLDTMKFFHNMVADATPDNVGVITSPMKLDAIKFDRDTPTSDGVAQAERDFWSGSGTSQLLFNADKSTSQGLLMSIKTDEEIVFALLAQIERWLNRYLKYQYSDLMFNVEILPVTVFNQQEKFKMYLEGSQYGVPVKNHLCATLGLSPIETMNMAYLENDLLQLHDKFIPLMSSHTLSGKLPTNDTGGRPKKDPQQLSDEGARNQDKPNANVK